MNETPKTDCQSGFKNARSNYMLFSGDALNG